jgi:F0F1-type ATP synthase assembly protein I
VSTLNDTCSDGVCTGQIGAASIPTTSEWGMIIFMTIIMGLGVVTLFRRRML